MSDATELGAALELATGSRVLSMARVPGGDINQAFKVALDDGRPVFVKTRHDAAAGEYAGEAAALDWLGEPDTLAVASVVAVHDPPSSHPGPRSLWTGSSPARGIRRSMSSSAAGWRACTTPGPRRSGPRRRRVAHRYRYASLRFSCPTSRPTTGAPSTPSGACARRSPQRGTAADCRRRAPVPWRMCVSASVSWPVRPSLRRACTATCGAAMCSPAPTAVRA